MIIMNKCIDWMFKEISIIMNIFYLKDVGYRLKNKIHLFH